MAVAEGVVFLAALKWWFVDLTANAASGIDEVLAAKAYSKTNEMCQTYINMHCAKRWAA